GGTAIFFIRRTVEPGKPYYTLELDEKALTVRQNRGLRNCGKTPEVQAFEEMWLAWVRAGARWQFSLPLPASSARFAL
ncbi:MAG: PcfJ domain-containing protein, partial [Muribaculaceae bacterium]|nr:PcfJ domain-containing protein [Muribaculaceae bacterium]